GIVGFCNFKNFAALAKNLPAAVLSLAHRGPDDSGLHIDPQNSLGLGHSRLSILDLSSAGRQPMKSPDGRAVITYNGEVYNFIAIRKELEKLGRTFTTGTDTEVVLAAYRQWGMDGCLNRLFGMFAFALWDQQERKLYIARDRMGVKPLYYADGDGFIAFASELKALKALGGICGPVDMDSLALFLHFQYVPGPRSIFENVRKLPPGCYGVFDGKSTQISRWWDFPEIAPQDARPPSEQESLNSLDSLLKTAVSDRLVSDVPIGALLSGGVDSSLVVAAMRRVAGCRVKTFTIGFSQADLDEAPYARSVAKYLDTDHTQLYASPKDALALVEQLPTMFDEPFADPSAIPTHMVCALARQKVTVALSGDGGDEFFAGYVRHWMAASLAKNLFALPAWIRRPAATFLGVIPPAWPQAAYKPFAARLPQRFFVRDFPEKWARVLAVMPENRLREIYRPTVSLWTREAVEKLLGRTVPESNFEKEFEATRGLPILRRLMQVDQKTYLPDAMFTKTDRTSMACGLEVRLPLCDHRIAAFAATLPESLLYRDGKGKYLPRKLLYRYVPQNLVDRPKAGFAVPLAAWLKGELKPLMTDLLAKKRLQDEGIFNPEMVGKVVGEHLNDIHDHAH
ncbi:MAG: asparagine synthase (glutamine-hydrolyzing), partial [Desulfatibacillaceae bacterium]|nr:asparagine synthase (glutamine-hydrolyzing) [Desulfatibacillaceae bacterium]